VKAKSIACRARLHAALGDETRLAIAEELRFSDRSPTELVQRFGLKSNLLAHHLDVLEESGAIERVSSSGDARRRYIRLASAALDVMGSPMPHPPRDVLFLCRRNSTRSQLATVVWRVRTGHQARSAGTHPAKTVNPGAVAAAKRLGGSLDGVVPTAIARVPRGVQVITVCDLVHEELEPRDDWWHWSIPAPLASKKPTAFDAVVDELNERMTRIGVSLAGGQHGKAERR
jgi:protein-tyrosine-phosphatase/DNA-binding HxlR family transcriptional regulator